tara:strand:+ start:121 stop:1155 length:1035 start_codon:yes stop_codon:yes gene_type:complete
LFVPSALAVDPNPSYQDKGDFYLTYEPTERFQEYEDWLKAEQYFEIQIPFLNETFKLPHDVDIIIAECGEANAYYFQGQIIMCYEFINQTDYRFANYFDIVYGEANWTTEDLNYSVINVIENVLYHEMGHALIEIYELPTTGPEESVADQFSAFILLEFPYEDDPTNSIGQDAMIDTAIDYWLAAEENPDLTHTAFADTHALNQQRFYDLACWAYGSDPNYNRYMLDEGWIPQNRLDWCELEYANMVYAWNILLAPFYKDFSPEFLYNYEGWFYEYLQTQNQTPQESAPESSAQQGIVAQESIPKVPDWVRNIFIWYGEEKISEDELLNAIKFLVSQGIIKVSP